MEWSTALPDWEQRIVNRQSLVPLDPLFPSEAESAMAIFNSLKMVDMGSGERAPTMGEVCRPFITDFVKSIFGAYDPQVGRRLISEFFFLISKKNGKSSTAAAVMITALLRNWRQSGEFLILAPTKEIADNSFFPARDMVKHDEVLSTLLHVQPNIRQITHRQTGATLKVVAADSDTVGGKKAIGVLIDELWLLGKQPNAENMLREATGGMASRPEGFIIYLSTQSDAPPAGVFRQKLQYARGVRDGRIKDNKFLPVLYEFPPAMLEDKSYEKPENFYITNPNLGASVDVEYIERESLKAHENGKESLPGFFAKSLNVEIGLNLMSDRWAGADFWQAAGDKSLTLDALLERCEVAVVGIDGGGLDDLLGISVLGREQKTGKWMHWGHAWAHRIVLSRRKEIASTLLGFENDGDLTMVDRPGDDVRQVAAVVSRVKKAGLLPDKMSIGVDAAGIGEIVNAMVSGDMGITMDHVIAISQGWKLNSAIKTTERRVAGGEFVHGSSRLMAWCVGNAKIEEHGNAIYVTKQASGKSKIDPLMALFDSVALMALNPVGQQKKFQFFSIG